jgi:citronellol/citronellal dehydrogenase
VGSDIFQSDLLAGQVAIVSGAGSGIGRATAQELAMLGMHVVICGRRPEPLEETVALVGARCEAHTCDIRDDEAVNELVDSVVQQHGTVDLLVNNAGGQFFAPAEEISAKGFRAVVELNLQGTWHMVHAVATRAMIPNGSGKIINFTLSPHNGLPGMVHSAAARAGVENLSRTLSVEWARFGIQVNAIALGQFATDTFLTKYPEPIIEVTRDAIPSGRLGNSQEVAWLVAALASRAGDFVTGSVLTVDGARDNWIGAWPSATERDAMGQPIAEKRKEKSA